MNIYKIIKKELNLIIKQLQNENIIAGNMDINRISIEPPRDSKHGDMATNAALLLAKPANMKPQALAQIIATKLEQVKYIKSAIIAGAGFINITLNNEFWHDLIAHILEVGSNYGASNLGNKQKVNIEYVSANPTGPLHVANARGAIIGDVLAELLQKTGFDVTKEYYINDAGAQINILAKSVYLRYLEANNQVIEFEAPEFTEGLYPGKYLIPLGQELKEKYGTEFIDKDESEWLSLFRNFATKRMLELIKYDLKLLGVNHDVFTSEKTLIENDKVDEAISILENNDLLYEGTLEPPKGVKSDDYKPLKQLLFKSSQFGDNSDRALKKSNGDWTYFASDIAYHYDKYKRGFNRQIDVWGADHGGYIKRMQAAVTAISNDSASLEVEICQMVRVLKDGKILKMSKRSGTFVTIKDLIEAVGKDVVRFFMMTRSATSPLDFDLNKVLEQTRENPVFYVQYAHARCCSVLRQAQETFKDADLSIENIRETDLNNIVNDEEKELFRKLASFSRLLENTALTGEAHMIAFYLYDIAALFHSLWQKGKKDTYLRFICEGDIILTNKRLAIIYCVKSVLASGLSIFNVTPLEEL